MKYLVILFWIASFSAFAQTAKNEAQTIKTERLQILQSERNNVLNALHTSTTTNDSEKTQRLAADLAALNKEILLVEKQTPIPTSVSRPTPAQPTNNSPLTSTTSTQTATAQQADFVYEKWDVFRNFGNKK